jgi:predicted glycosyltransferase
MISRAHGRRCFLYSQHMAGTGHFVRTCEIAKALGRRHEIRLIDGGRPVPREFSRANIQVVSLPRIRRDGQGIVPLDSDEPIAGVMQRRLRILLASIEQFQPQAVVIEHFPLRRWELHAEIIALIERAREVNPAVKIVSSFRDILGLSRCDPPTEEHGCKLLEVLHEYFDQLLVHADPRLIRLDEQTRFANRIEIPIEYTGYVSQRLGKGHTDAAHTQREDGMVIASAGGTGDTFLLEVAIDAWTRATVRRAMGKSTLLVFLPLSIKPHDVALLRRRAGDHSIRLMPYTTDFLDWMQLSDLSISHSGYNTCTNILETRTRSILVPNLEMSDQRLRARRLAERGLACSIEPAELTPDRLADAMIDRIQEPAPEHDIDLDGASATCRILNRILAEEPAIAAPALESAGS